MWWLLQRGGWELRLGCALVRNLRIDPPEVTVSPAGERGGSLIAAGLSLVWG